MKSRALRSSPQFARDALRLAGAAVLVCAGVMTARAQEPPPPPAENQQPAQGPVIRSESSLVLVSVLAVDTHNGTVIDDMEKPDFSLYQDGKYTQIQSFQRGPDPAAEPVVVWLIVSCPQKGRPADTSDFLAGHIPELQAGLAKLNEQDKAGVAHWCGDSLGWIDLEPVLDRKAPLSALEEILKAPPTQDYDATRQGGLKALLADVAEKSRKANVENPALVFLHGDSIESPPADKEAMLNSILHASGMVYGISAQEKPAAKGKTKNSEKEPATLIGYLSAETGGRMQGAQPGDYGGALGRIADQIHFRYQLGFAPKELDGRLHKIQVVPSIRFYQKGRHAVFGYRSAFVASANSAARNAAEEAKMSGVTFDSALQRAIHVGNPPREIAFRVDGDKLVTFNPQARFTLKVDPNSLTWTRQANGDEMTTVTLCTASLSNDGESFEYNVSRYDLSKKATLEDGSVILRVTIGLNPNMVRERFIVRDDATGRLGVQDFNFDRFLR